MTPTRREFARKVGHLFLFEKGSAFGADSQSLERTLSDEQNLFRELHRSAKSDSMATHWFSPPVPVRTEGPGLTRHVNNAVAAANELLKWTNRGPDWNLAVRVCVAVIADEIEPEECRKAFLAAAMEEGVDATLV